MAYGRRPNRGRISAVWIAVLGGFGMCGWCSPLAHAGGENAGRPGTTPPVPPFGFRALEFFKASENSRCLRAADLDQDGRMDLLFADNEDGTVRLLYQKASSGGARQEPEAELNEPPVDRRFRVEKIYTEKHISALECGDFDADGRPDIAFYSDPPELEILYQGTTWGERRQKFPVRDGLPTPLALACADYDGDGLDDLALLGRGRTYLFRQKATGTLAPPSVLYQSAEDVLGLHWTDADGDGRLDLVYIVPGDEVSVRVRLQTPSGFGPEIGSRLHPLSAYDLGLFSLAPGESAKPTIVAVQASTKRLQVLRWESGSSPRALGSPLGIALPRGEKSGKEPRLLADVDGDGRTDVAVGRPERAELLVFFQDGEGRLARSGSYPTLSDLVDLVAADTDGDGRRELVVASGREKAIGVSRWENGRLGIPHSLPLTEEPILIAAVPASAVGVDGPGDVLLSAVKPEKGGYAVLALRVAEGGLETLGRTPLPLRGAPPNSLTVLDADGDGAAELLLTVPYEDAYLLVLKKQEAGDSAGAGRAAVLFEDISRAPGFGLGQLAKLEPRRLSPSRETADCGLPAGFLVTSASYARLLRLGGTPGRLRIEEQIPPPAETSRLGGGVLVNLDSDPEAEVALVDETANRVEILDRSAGGTYRPGGGIDIPKADILRLERADLNGDGRDDVVIHAKTEILVLLQGASESAFRPKIAYGVEKEELGKPQDVCLGDFNGDGTRDIVTSTAPRYRLLFLSPEPAPPQGPYRLKERLAFPIFEEKPHTRQDTTLGPREMLARDIDGDGLDDLLLLIHNRILLYLQDETTGGETP